MSCYKTIGKAFNRAREIAIYEYLKQNFPFDTAKECGEWVEVNIQVNEVTMTHVRAKKGTVEAVVESEQGRWKSNFSMLNDNPEVQQVEYYGLVLLCGKFGLFFGSTQLVANGICLN